MRKTKIICTLGPSTDKGDVLKQLMLNGMDVARFNFSHQTHEEHKSRLEKVIKMREELNLPIATLLDTKGPEVRTGLLKDKYIELFEGEKIILTTKDIIGDNTKISITYKDLPSDIAPGQRILIDDGLIELIAEEIDSENIYCKIINGGTISNSKGVNIPGVRLSMPYISQKDREDIIFGCETGFDFIAASFVRCAEDILEVREIAEKHGRHNIRIIAKIENSDGVDNIDDILRVSDGIMVARGDMGVEIPLQEIPVLQKLLIQKGYNYGRQVITATQMLDSMMIHPRPTRAETTDVANAIYDGTSAIMLSGETAAGKYPVESLKTMSTIAIRTELDIDYVKRFNLRNVKNVPNVTNAISHATVTTAHDMGASAIITVTKTGQTARMISKYRPLSPIISCTTSDVTYRQLNLSWGVIPLMMEEKNSTDELFQSSVDRAIEEKLLQNGDLAVITAGIPLGISGTTNMLKVHVVGNVLVSGSGVTHGVACGNLCVCTNDEQALKNFKTGDILVIPQTNNDLLPLLKRATGIVTEVLGGQSHAAVVGLTLNIPVIVGAQNATTILKSGLTVTIDADRGIVCGTEHNNYTCPISK